MKLAFRVVELAPAALKADWMEKEFFVDCKKPDKVALCSVSCI